ncbi:MAG: fasciclin domain-containing protein [Fuerstiella sp.]|nr:fasciclin domain-containing protein [Fuerstiella sp.]
MNKLITLIVVAMFASTAVAGDRCKGTVILSRKIRQPCPGTYIRAAHAAARPDIVDTAVEAGSFKTLVAAVKAAGMVETLKGPGPFTVFAPTDEAFARLPKGTLASLLKSENKAKLQDILTYHVVSGSVKAADIVKLTGVKTVQGQQVDITVKDHRVSVDGANVVKADIETGNGVIHVIDRVILPADKDTVDTAVEAGGFNTLVAAVKAAGLVDTLKGEGPFTVFAPTDDAFAKLPDGTISSLLKPENKDQLAAILTYHVVPGKVLASDLVQICCAKTVNGKSARVTVSDAGVMIDRANVVATDIETSNGAIHVIDRVMLP